MARLGRAYPARAIVARPPADLTPPTVPGSLRVAVVTQSVIRVVWDAAEDDYTLAGYGVYLGGAQVDEVGPDTLEYTFDGLDAGTSYTLGVDAFDAAGNRSAVATLEVATLPLDETPPSMPGNPRIVAAGPYRLTLTWDPASDNVGVFGYGVYLGGVLVDEVGAEVLEYTFTGLDAGTSYTLGVDAFDAAGNRSAVVWVAAETTGDAPPGAPPAGGMVDAGRVWATIRWAAAEDDDRVAGYRIWLDGAQVEELWAGLEFTFEGLAAGTAYVAEVAAVDTAGQVSPRLEIPFVTVPDYPPGPPPELRQTGATYTSITVEWDEAADDVAVAGYDVRLDGVLVSAEQTEREFTFTGLTEGTTYLVEVFAVDDIGQRGEPARLEASTLDDTNPEPVEVTVEPGETTLTVQWSESSDDFGVTRYEILLDGEVVHVPPLDGVEWTIDGPVVRTHVIGDLAAGTPYTVAVRVTDTIGQTTTTAVQTATLPVLFVPLDYPVYRLGAWAGNVTDEHGVDWVVEEAEGWASTPPVKSALAEGEAIDGGATSAGLFGARTVTLSGVAIAPTRSAMLAAKQRITAAVHPGDTADLLVQGVDRTLRARVRLSDQVVVEDRGPLVFRWTLSVTAGDPRRYVARPTRAVAVVESLPGEAAAVIEMTGTYPQVPARLRLYGPIRNWVISHRESGLALRSRSGLWLPADPDTSLAIDLGARTVTYYQGGVPGPGRAQVAHLPGWFLLVPGTNTITLSGEPAPGSAGTPRLVVEAYNAY